MKVIPSILLCHIGWVSATLMIYHEPSMKIFGDKITTNKSSFGYSVTYTPNNKKLIVSAPKATDHGALFSCDVNKSNCSAIPIDTKQIEAPKNHHIWLGATVRAGSNFFVTCAPRYVEDRYDLKATPGYCYKYSGTYNQMPEKLTFDPNLIDSVYFERKYMFSFGWSMDINENDDTVIGGPAMSTGRVVKYPKALNKPILITPGNQKAPFLKTNFGYSVLHRTYKSKLQLAISSTYGEEGKGMVVLFKAYSRIVKQVIGLIRGKQVGAMFGASLCAARVDSMGQSLLLVGAPTYTSDNTYNTGAVFIYKDMDFDYVFKTVKGTSVGGQFGYTCANLGDLNGDDKDEIAISAPYEDEGQGAVYIYSGVQLLDRDIEVTWLQRIQHKEYRAFGLSLYAIPDHDRNGCKELAIGSPENDRAVLLSCFATIIVTVRKLKPQGKINDTAGYSSFKFESCVSFQYPELPDTITANFSVGLDISGVRIKLPATKQVSNDSIRYNIHVTPDKKPEYCEDLIISVPSDKPYDPTIHYVISAVHLNDPKYMSTFDPTRVTVSDLSRLTIPGTTWIGECENGEKCIPKLEMELTSSVTNSTYIVGSTDVETLKVSVKNSGDPAYEACVQVKLDGNHGIDLLSWPPSCTLPEGNSRRMLICNPTKLLRKNTYWDIDEIKLDMRSIKSKAAGGHGYFEVQVHLYEECNKKITEKPMKTIKSLLRWDSEHVTVIGLIKYGGVINITKNEIESSSKQIQHEYEIFNYGPTTWDKVEVDIHLEKEFYLEGIPATSGHFYQCSPAAETDKEYINHCIITIRKSDMNKNSTFVIVQPIEISSKIYETLRKKQLKITSSLKMSLDGDEKIASVITTLRFYEIEVETWIIGVAVLFGLLIIAIMIFILYECGFLRRKKKDDLTHLRRSVQRQSMRRTTMIQHSVHIEDKEKLIDPAEEANPDGETTCSPPKVDVKEKVEIHPQKENQKEIAPYHDEKHKIVGEDTGKPICKPKPQGIEAAAIGSDEKNKNHESSKIKRNPSLKTKQNDPIAGIIIGGLQKNIRHRDVPPSLEGDRSVD